MKGAVTHDVWSVLFAVEREVARARALHQDNDKLPDFGKWTWPSYIDKADTIKADAKIHAALGTVSWDLVLLEEVAEAIEATDSEDHLIEELVQVAAVAVGWAEAIHRRCVNATVVAVGLAGSQPPTGSDPHATT